MKKRSFEVIRIFIPLFLFYLGLGVYLSQVRGFLPGDSLARMVSAWLVHRGTVPKLSSIGFVWPPIPTLLIIPFTFIPYLVKTWTAVIMVSSISMAISGVLIFKIAKLCSIPGLWKDLLVVLFATNPLIIIFGANGMSEAILIAVVLGAFYWFVQFWRTDSNMALVLSAGFFGLLPLIRYEAILVTGAVAIIIMIQSWVKRYHLDEVQLRAFLEGRLLAYGSLGIYPIFLWMVASWQIMGSPFYFINNPQSAVNIAEGQLHGINTQLGPAILLAFRLWIVSFPFNCVATIIALFYGLYRKNYFLVSLSSLNIITPLAQGFLLSQSSTVPLLRYFIINIPISVVTLFCVWKDFSLNQNSVNEVRPQIRIGIWTAVFIVFLGSNLSTAYQLTYSEFQSNENPTWLGLVSSDPVPYMHIRQAGEGLKVGKVLPDIIPEGKRVLLDTYAGGYAIILASGNPDLFLDFTDPNYKLAVRRPWEYADYVLVPSQETEGKFSEINQYYPHLHDQGAEWAEFVDALPSTLYDWKLYKIIVK
jgi:hypothetical protein